MKLRWKEDRVRVQVVSAILPKYITEKAPIAEHSFDHLDFIDFSYSRYLNRSHWQGRSIQAPLRLFL